MSAMSRSVAIGRAVIATVASVAMILALDSLGPPAVASPVTISAPAEAAAAKAKPVKERVTFSRTALKAAKQSAKIARKAMSKSGKTMNYAKAKKVGGRKSWRRQFAAGFYWQGGVIKHISKGELEKVKAYLPPSPAGQVKQAAPNCQGVTKTVQVKADRLNRVVDNYLDSCRTLDLEFIYDQAGATACGVAAGASGLVSFLKKIPDKRVLAAYGVFASVCVFYMKYNLARIQKAVAKSSISALIIRNDSVYHAVPKGNATYYTDVRYYPQ